MYRNSELHTFLLSRAKNLTEEWYNSLDKSDSNGVYSSTDPEQIKKVKQQNYEFHIALTQIFVEEESVFYNNFNKWIVSVARDDNHLKTPIHFIIREFVRVRDQYLLYVKEFAAIHDDKYDAIHLEKWTSMIQSVFDYVIQRFVEESYQTSLTIMKAQEAAYRETLSELSSPIIPIADKIGVLPLIGDIDSHRAKMIQQSCLKKGSELQLTHLVIDLSGVPFIDTMVANELFQTMKGLSLLGIRTVLTGIRPAIAQTSVSLGLDFTKYKTYATLKQALTDIQGHR